MIRHDEYMYLIDNSYHRDPPPLYLFYWLFTIFIKSHDLNHIYLFRYTVLIYYMPRTCHNWLDTIFFTSHVLYLHRLVFLFSDRAFICIFLFEVERLARISTRSLLSDPCTHIAIHRFRQLKYTHKCKPVFTLQTNLNEI